MKKLSVILPCFGRKERTIRSLDCVLNQDFLGWELFFIGDHCPDYENLIKSDYFSKIVKELNPENNIIYYNLEKNYGGYGYHIINSSIKNLNSEYTIFFANDDVIAKNHFSNYYNEISKSDYDFVYFNSLVRFDGEKCYLRDSQLTLGSCGHAELIIKTDLLKTLPKHQNNYGHDFNLIENLLSKTSNYRKSQNEPTYVVMSTPDNTEEGID